MKVYITVEHFSGFPTILAIIFVALKTVHIINWSWAWVLSPLWIQGGLFVLAVDIIWLIKKWSD